MSQAPDPSLGEPLLVPLSTPDTAVLDRVGGKAASLIRLQQAGFDVPEGVVLTTQFFSPWITQIQASHEWRRWPGWRAPAASFVFSDASQLDTITYDWLINNISLALAMADGYVQRGPSSSKKSSGSTTISGAKTP
jgi:hypothetical protein